jgi:hypothetical protein
MSFAQKLRVARILAALMLGYAKNYGYLDISWFLVFLPIYFSALLFGALAFMIWLVLTLIERYYYKK